MGTLIKQNIMVDKINNLVNKFFDSNGTWPTVIEMNIEDYKELVKELLFEVQEDSESFDYGNMIYKGLKTIEKNIIYVR
jgi:hypothetical protein